jgi:hypothetical protein
VPSKRTDVTNEKPDEALEGRGMSNELATTIAPTSEASSHGGRASGSGRNSSPGGTTAQRN